MRRSYDKKELRCQDPGKPRMDLTKCHAWDSLTNFTMCNKIPNPIDVDDILFLAERQVTWQQKFKLAMSERLQ